VAAVLPQQVAPSSQQACGGEQQLALALGWLTPQQADPSSQHACGGEQQSALLRD